MFYLRPPKLYQSTNFQIKITKSNWESFLRTNWLKPQRLTKTTQTTQPKVILPL